MKKLSTRKHCIMRNQFLLLCILLIHFATQSQSLTVTATGNGEWVCPVNVTSITIQAWGGGGGGGYAIGVNGAAGGGGGGGEYRAVTIAVTPGQTYYYTVGSGGSGGTNAGIDANEGGITCFSTSPNCVNNLILSNGGQAGQGVNTNSSGAGGIGGTAGIGGIGRSGGNGSNGVNGDNNSAGGGGGGGGAGTNTDGGNASGRTRGNGGTDFGGNGGSGPNSNNGAVGSTIGGGGSGGHRRGGNNRNGGNGARGELRLTWTIPNDDCINAITITPSLNFNCDSPVEGDTRGATQSFAGCNGTANDDIWYRFTATRTTHYVNVTPLTMLNPVFQVFSGSCGSLNSIVCRNNAGNNLPESAALTNLTIGATYFIRVYTAGISGMGSFEICVTSPPVNDDCINAVSLTPSPNTSCSNSIVGDSSGGTQSLPGCSGTANDDVWYSFVATSTMHYVDVTPISMLNPVLQVYSGSCGSLSSIVCRNIAGNNLPETATLNNLTIGQTYIIRVHTSGTSGMGTFEICVRTEPLPTNDDCETAIELPVNLNSTCTNFVTGSTLVATQSIPALICNGTGNADDDVWYKFIALEQSHIVTVNSTSINDIVIDIRTGGCNGTNIACANNTTGAAPESVNLTNLIVGQEYFVRIYSFGGNAFRGSFTVCITTPSNQVVSADNVYTVTELVENVLFNNSCVSISNINWRTGTNFGQANGIGYFYNNGSSFPFENGIVLSTGGANYATGPINEFTNSIGTNAWLGDANVQSVMSAVSGSPQTARNASFIEFDFVPFQDTISFDFLFASNEYGQWQCDFSDTFIFLLTNLSNGTTTNIAVVPSTTTPISVVSIRNNAFNGGCNSVNPSFFGNFYFNNPDSAPINFRGATIPMTAVGSVVPGQAYRIKLAIADRLDTLLDSAVFIKGSSFSIGDIALGDDLFIVDNTALCYGESVLLNPGLDGTIFDFEWYQDDELMIGQNTPTLNVTEWGNYRVKATIKGNPGCFVEDDVTIEIFPEINPLQPRNIIKCNFGEPFDLTENTPRLLTLYPAPVYGVSYFTSLSNAQNNVNPIPDPTSFTETVNPQRIFARVFNIERGCYGIRSFWVRRPKTWNGSVNSNWDHPNNWTPIGVPTNEDCIIVHATANDPIISGTGYVGYGYNIDVRDNARLIVQEDCHLSIVDQVVVRPNGLMEFRNNASLVQVNNATNTGQIRYIRNAFIRQLDYVYWSSPVENFHIHSVSPATPASRIYQWNTTVVNSNNSFGNWQLANEIMIPGKGYIVRGPNGFTTTPQWFTATFTGRPRNGTIQFPIQRGNYTGAPFLGTNGVEVTNMDDNFNLIGNPYPSAISYDDFIDANPDLEGSIRVWTHGTPISNANSNPFYGSFGYNYSSNDYIIHNKLGTISGPDTYNGYIPAGQGFFVLMNDGPAATSVVTFTNEMRRASNNNQFYRLAQTTEAQIDIDKLWIDLVAPNGNASRTLIGYHPQATNERDRLFDAFLRLENSNTIYSLINGERFSIQGRAPFSVHDIVPIGFRATTAGNYQIAIGFAEGRFNENQTVYLKDLNSNTIHNLSESPYLFFSAVGNFENRFELWYINQTLGVNTHNANDIRVITNDKITVYSGREIINHIKIYDMQGRLLYQTKEVSSNEKTLIDFMKINQTLLVSIGLDSGKEVHKKIIF